MGATMRLGAYKALIRPGTLAHKLYGKDSVTERHRHRYEFNPAYRDELENAGLVISAVNDEHGLVEVVELPEHPFFIACQYHPEFQSAPNRAHPLFSVWFQPRWNTRATPDPSIKPGAFSGISIPEKAFSFQACSRTFSSSSSTFWLSSA